jgi:hypothetical protein
MPSDTLLLPLVGGGGPAATQAPDPVVEAISLYGLIKNDDRQERARLEWHSDIARVAEDKLHDMQRRHYYNHLDPDGHGPNWWLKRAGLLPSGYPQGDGDNSLESLTNNVDHAVHAFTSLRDSPLHRDHIFGRGWFGGQDKIGIACGPGFAPNCWWLWVILITH